MVVTVAPEGTAATNGAAIELARHWRPGIDVRGTLFRGPASQALAALSDSAHALVVGSRGRGPVRSALLGSVSASVSGRAACPVVVCRPGSVGRVQQGILVAADGTPESLPSIDFAFRQASLRDVPLTVAGDLPGAGPSVLALAAAESAAGFRELFPEVRVSVEPDRSFADEARGAASARWTMVVVGRRTAGNGRGGRATDVLEHARTLVAVVPTATDQPPAIRGTKDPSLAAPLP